MCPTKPVQTNETLTFPILNPHKRHWYHNARLYTILVVEGNQRHQTTTADQWAQMDTRFGFRLPVERWVRNFDALNGQSATG